MEDRSTNPKHSVGKGAQKEKYNADNEESYVKKPEKDSGDKSEEGEDYLEKKWKQIHSDFQQKYNIEVSESKYKSHSLTEILKDLEEKTGKSREQLRREISEWQND